MQFLVARLCGYRKKYRIVYNFFADEIWHPPITLLSDSQSLVSIVNKERDVKSLRHCKRRLFYLRQVTIENEI